MTSATSLDNDNEESITIRLEPGASKILKRIATLLDSQPIDVLLDMIYAYGWLFPINSKRTYSYEEGNDAKKESKWVYYSVNNNMHLLPNIAKSLLPLTGAASSLSDIHNSIIGDMKINLHDKLVSFTLRYLGYNDRYGETKVNVTIDGEQDSITMRCIRPLEGVEIHNHYISVRMVSRIREFVVKSVIRAKIPQRDVDIMLEVETGAFDIHAARSHPFTNLEQLELELKSRYPDHLPDYHKFKSILDESTELFVNEVSRFNERVREGRFDLKDK